MMLVAETQIVTVRLFFTLMWCVTLYILHRIERDGGLQDLCSYQKWIMMSVYFGEKTDCVCF